MSDEVLGRGVIELVADARKLRAGIAEAKQSIRTLGEDQNGVSKSAAASIDAYIARLQVQQKTMNMSSRETELYRLTVRGASNEQIKLADSTLRTIESQERFARASSNIRTGLVTIGAAAVTGLIAASVAFDELAKKAGDFQDMAEKAGDTAANFSSLAVAANIGNIEMDSLVGASVKLTKNLTGVDDESKAAGAAIKALGLDLKAIKGMAPAEQFETIAQALDGFADGSQKSAVAVALFGKSGAEMLPFLKELSGGVGRVNILTDEQIRLADEYADKQAKNNALISLHAQAIATEMLPAFTDLTGASLDLIKGISGVRGGLNDLSGNRAIQEFAEDAAFSLAVLVESLVFVGKTVKSVAGSFDVMFADVSTTAKFVTSAGGLLDKDGLAAAVEDRNRRLEEANKNYRDLFDYDATALSRGVRQRADQRMVDRAYIPDDYGYDPYGENSGGAPKKKRKLKFNGPEKNGSADQIAKAQLAADLDAIKKAGEAQANAYANAEKIMEARRAAGLLDEREYYAAKLSFLNLNALAQEKAAQEEIARLESENAVGKDRIENQRKIADLQATINKIREGASADTETLSIQEVAANKKIAQSYIDATIAAQAYIQTVIDRNAREVAGVGRGDKYRSEQDGRNQIEDKLTVQRQTLERDLRNNQITQKQFDDYLGVAQRTYDTEIALYVERTRAIDDANSKWVNGANEAFANYRDIAANTANQTRDLFTDALTGIEDAFVEFAKTGKLSFSSLADSIIADLVRMQVKAAMAPVTSGISGWLSGLFSSPASGTGAGSASSAPVGSLWGAQIAHSGAIAGSGEGNGSRYVSAEVFSGARRYHGGGLAADEVPAILQEGEGVFTRGQMAALGAGKSGVVVNLIESPGSGKGGSTSTSTGANGDQIITVIVERIKGDLINDVGSGGSFASAMESQYALNRAAGTWR